MIAAAADGTISPEAGSHPGPDWSFEPVAGDTAFLEKEFSAPADVDALPVRSDSDTRQVYAVSLLAIEVDTDAERAYIKAFGWVLTRRP